MDNIYFQFQSFIQLIDLFYLKQKTVIFNQQIKRNSYEAEI